MPQSTPGPNLIFATDLYSVAKWWTLVEFMQVSGIIIPITGIGTVTSVGISGSDFTIIGSPITTSGTINLSIASTCDPDWLTCLSWDKIIDAPPFITWTDLFAIIPLEYNDTDGTFSIEQSGTAQDGYLSSEDWNTFNNKQVSLSGTGIIKSTAGTISYITGTSAQFVKADGSLDSNTYLTSASISGLVPYTGATGNVDLGLFKLTTADLTVYDVSGSTAVIFKEGVTQGTDDILSVTTNANVQWFRLRSGFGGYFSIFEATSGSSGGFLFANASSVFPTFSCFTGSTNGFSYTTQNGKWLYGSNGLLGWTNGTAGAGTTDSGVSRISTGLLGVGVGTAGDFTGKLALGRLLVGTATDDGVNYIQSAGAIKTPKVTLPGATSGSASLQAASITTTYLATLPASDGTSGQILSTDGANVWSWTTVGTGTVTSVSGIANRISVATGTTTPVIDIAATYVGQTSITTLGTVGTGVWSGTTIGLSKGGTNSDLSGTGGTKQVLRQSSTGAAITVGQLALTDMSDYVDWTTFAPAATGFSGTPTVLLAQYRLVGDVCFIMCTVSGTSNSTLKSFTLPFTSIGVDQFVVVQCASPASTLGGGTITAGTNSISLRPTFPGGSWASSGTAFYNASFYYRKV